MLSSTPASVRVLLVEDDDGYARLIAKLVEHAQRGGDIVRRIELSRVARLTAARSHLGRREIDLVLLDLTLPDSQGLDTLLALSNEFPELAIVVVTGMADEAVALAALQHGAQDYLIKSEVDARALMRSIRYSLERHRLQEQLRGLTLTDSLTGLHNRRGFMTLAERQLRLVHRRASGAAVVLLDLDGLKVINDRFGHAEGDRALERAASALRGAFREADIIGRIGGDEFAVIALDVAPGDEPSLVSRIAMQLSKLNAEAGQAYEVRLSLGWARLEPQSPQPLDALLAEADRHLYDHKRRRETRPIVKSERAAR